MWIVCVGKYNYIEDVLRDVSIDKSALLGYFYQTFEINMILLGSIFCILGGATHTTTALVYSEAAIFTKNRSVLRVQSMCFGCSYSCLHSTATFSLLEGIIQISQLVGPVIGSSLLMIGLYIPYYFAFTVAIMQIPLVLCLPSGKQSDLTTRKDIPEQETLLNPESEIEGEGATLLNAGGTAIAYAPRKSSYQEVITTIKEDTRRFVMMFTKHNIVIYAHAACLVITLGKQALHILLQYVSKRFGITLAQVSDDF
jgi:hypothetical protein